VLSIVQYYIEQHFGRGVAGAPAKFSFRMPFRSNTPLSGGVEESKA
jgi:hypothetical protein